MKRQTLIISIILHSLLLIIVFIFQSMIFPYLRLSGLTPLILPIVSTGVAICEGRDAGGIMGIFAGIFCDVSLNEPVGVFVVLLTIMGLIVGALADTVIARGFATYFLCCAAALIISALVQMFPLAFLQSVPVRPLMTTAVQQTVYSLLFSLPIWFFVRALGKRAQRVSPSGRPL
jgi:rod shape-determining protein MreD